MGPPDTPSAPDLSIIGLLAHADIVVQGVVTCLVLCSIVSWAIIVEKSSQLRRLNRTVRRAEAAPLGAGDGRRRDILSKIHAVSSHESEAARRSGDTTDVVRLRLEEAMRAVYVEELRRLESGLMFLATLGSAAPFVGLFGTVWGIMRSFTSIAAAKDTSLAVVAPGIAEALVATAFGLAAAIPAVVAYNLILATLSRSGQRLGAVVAAIARRAAIGDGAGAVG